jgi:hypothetical protein
MSGVKKFFLVLLALLGLVVCVVVGMGMMIYQNRRRILGRGFTEL